MNRRLVFLVAGLLVFFAVKDASAICWNLTGFSDIIRAKIAGDATTEHRALNGVWFAPGTYLIPIVGTVELEFGGGTARRLAMIGSQQDLGGGMLNLEGTVDRTNLEGTVTVTDSVGNSLGTFVLDKVDCASVPTAGTASVGTAPGANAPSFFRR